MEGPSYGVADHYLGEKGETYFAWQGAGGDFAGRINRHKFSHLVRPDMTIIDFGCGGGALLRNLECARRIGIEINPAARAFANANGVECHATVNDVADGIADLIITDHALEHVPFAIGALRELKPKLRRGGLLSACVPHNNYWEDRRVRPDRSELSPPELDMPNVWQHAD